MDKNKKPFDLIDRNEMKEPGIRRPYIYVEHPIENKVDQYFERYSSNWESNRDLDGIDKVIKRECKSQITAEKYSYYCSQFENWLFKNGFDPGNPTEEDIYRYFDHNDHWAPNTRRMILQALRYKYNKIQNRGLIINLNIKHQTKDPYVLSQEDLKKFFDSIDNPYHKLILKFKYSCGIRSLEMAHLRWCDINKVSNTGQVLKGKLGKDRVIHFLYYGPEILNELFKYKGKAKDTDFIFPFRNRFGIWYICNKAAINFGDPEITPHTLRHCFGTHLAEHGHKLIEIRDLMGHSHVQATEIYIKLAGGKRLQEININQPLNF